MLPAPSRLRTAEDFRRTISGGVRAGRKTLVVHARAGNDQDPVRVGFVVSKAVGNAVVRNRVKRQLRHLAVPLMAGSPSGMSVVVRALPAAARSGASLSDDLRAAWETCERRLRGVPRVGSS